MTMALTTDEFEFIAGLLKQRSGLALTPDKGYLLETRLNPLAKANGMADLKELIARLRSNPNAPVTYQVIEAMTTNESMFFRDSKPFDQLSKVILPDLVKAKNRNAIRIWSAACSTGQEAYSTAMLLKEESAKYPGLSAEIYATDLAEKVVERARAGIYSQFEVQRGLPIAHLMKYFTQRPNNNWEITDTLKAMVKFTTGNLLTPFTAGKFDIIFCRNVLIYFDEKTKSDVLDRMAGVLTAPGYLFLGGSETVHGLTSKFKLVDEQRGLFTLA